MVATALKGNMIRRSLLNKSWFDLEHLLLTLVKNVTMLWVLITTFERFGLDLIRTSIVFKLKFHTPCNDSFQNSEIKPFSKILPYDHTNGEAEMLIVSNISLHLPWRSSVENARNGLSDSSLICLWALLSWPPWGTPPPEDTSSGGRSGLRSVALSSGLEQCAGGSTTVTLTLDLHRE